MSQRLCLSGALVTPRHPPRGATGGGWILTFNHLNAIIKEKDPI